MSEKSLNNEAYKEISQKEVGAMVSRVKLTILDCLGQADLTKKKGKFIPDKVKFQPYGQYRAGEALLRKSYDVECIVNLVRVAMELPWHRDALIRLGLQYVHSHIYALINDTAAKQKMDFIQANPNWGKPLPVVSGSVVLNQGQVVDNAPPKENFLLKEERCALCDEKYNNTTKDQECTIGASSHYWQYVDDEFINGRLYCIRCGFIDFPGPSRCGNGAVAHLWRKKIKR